MVYSMGQEHFLSYLPSYTCGISANLQMMKTIRFEDHIHRVDWNEDLLLSQDEKYLIFRRASSNRDIAILDVSSGKEAVDDDHQQQQALGGYNSTLIMRTETPDMDKDNPLHIISLIRVKVE